jgi:hypothetical protein
MHGATKGAGPTAFGTSALSVEQPDQVDRKRGLLDAALLAVELEAPGV